MSSRGDPGSHLVEFKKEKMQSVPQRSKNDLTGIGALRHTCSEKKWQRSSGPLSAPSKNRDHLRDLRV